MPRAPRPDDLYTLRVPGQPAISPDGDQVVFTLKTAAVDKDGYRRSLWRVRVDGSAPARQLTLGAKSDAKARWSPDGSTIAFLSDRGAILQAGGGGDLPAKTEAPKDGKTQVWLLPADGGEAIQLTRLPEDVSDLDWNPDGTRLVLVSGATRATRAPEQRRAGDPPKRDARLIDRLDYMVNGGGFIYDKPSNLWLVDVADGTSRRLTTGRASDEQPAWSPDGRHIAFSSDRHADADLSWRSDIYLADVETGRVRRVTGGRGDRAFRAPAWSPDGRRLAAIGHRFPAGAGSRAGVWLFDPGVEGQGDDLTAGTDHEVGAAMGSDLFGGAEATLSWSPDGRRIVFGAPIDGSYEAWRVEVATRRIERLTQGRHYLGSITAGGRPDGSMRLAAVRVAGTDAPDVVTGDIPAGGLAKQQPIELRRVSDLNGAAWGDIALVEPQERWHEVDGRRIQGCFIRSAAGRAGRRPPLVLQIHGGPATLYGWSIFWEWQCLAAAGMSVYACNPRGSQGYGEAFTHANYGDWGPGPMRDVMAGVDSLIDDGLADPDRLGVTGGSYGGYLTSWIVGHTDRFKAAVTCRSVNDLYSMMLSGDIAGPEFAKLEFGASAWEDPDALRAQSPITFADRITTPLLIQHAENDVRTPMTQAEELFTVLRSLKRPVRLMRVPEETHELTRSGAPFRRVENIERIRDWFAHYLVQRKGGLPPI
ncbi:MAG: S9 family peptidase [Chloroflexi bacterium]|nr:S9 family peptidase [Chloroflexota bacterium]